jgi:hypothetical protein
VFDATDTLMPFMPSAGLTIEFSVVRGATKRSHLDCFYDLSLRGEILGDQVDEFVQ